MLYPLAFERIRISLLGGDYKDDDAYPGVALYHEGIDLIAVVSTDEDVWSLRVRGQLMNKTWSNIAIRWEKTYTTNSGGLEVSAKQKL